MFAKLVGISEFTSMTHPMIQQIAQAIAESGNNPRTADNIRAMHQHPQGAETLRLIVRDDIAGAGETVANTLWQNL